MNNNDNPAPMSAGNRGEWVMTKREYLQVLAEHIDSLSDTHNCGILADRAEDLRRMLAAPLAPQDAQGRTGVDERTAFEAWAETQALDHAIKYQNRNRESAWTAWQARAMLSASPAPPPSNGCAVIVPRDVMEAAERMAVPLADGRPTLTDKLDEQCSQRILSFLRSLAAAPQPSADGLTIDDYKESFASHRRLVRELDVLLNGESGAAKQASLCDIVSQVESERIRSPQHPDSASSAPEAQGQVSEQSLQYRWKNGRGEWSAWKAISAAIAAKIKANPAMAGIEYEIIPSAPATPEAGKIDEAMVRWVRELPELFVLATTAPGHERLRGIAPKLRAIGAALEAAVTVKPEAVERAANREQHRALFSEDFNRWLDEGISDAGHTVWDTLRNVSDAWHGWEARAHYDQALQRREPDELDALDAAGLAGGESGR